MAGRERELMSKKEREREGGTGGGKKSQSRKGQKTTVGKEGKKVNGVEIATGRRHAKNLSKFTRGERQATKELV